MFALSTYRRPAGSLTNWVDEFLNSEFRSRDLETSWTPRVDIVEEDNAYRVRADLPGLEKKDVDVTVENGIMTIRGERKFERTDKKDNSYEYYERRYGSFSRSFNLPENVDSTGIEATYRNGVLDITLRKSEKAKPKQVEIKLR